MIVSPDPFLDECFIKKPSKKTQPNNDLEKLINQSVEDLVKKNINIEKQYDKYDNNQTNDLDNDTCVNNLEKSIDTNIDNNQHFETDNGLIELEDTDIVLDVEEIEEPINTNDLKEVDLSTTLDNNLETITLKKPNQVYYEIYQKAREKAKEAKKNALLAYLEMKNIKKTYMLDDIDESDSEFDEFTSKDSSEISDTEILDDNF